MFQNFLSNVVEHKLVIYRWSSLGAICAPVATMECELFVLMVRAAQYNLIVVHLHNALLALLSIIEGTHSHNNLDIVCHQNVYICRKGLGFYRA